MLCFHLSCFMNKKKRAFRMMIVVFSCKNMFCFFTYNQMLRTIYFKIHKHCLTLLWDYAWLDAIKRRCSSCGSLAPILKLGIGEFFFYNEKTLIDGHGFSSLGALHIMSSPCMCLGVYMMCFYINGHSLHDAMYIFFNDQTKWCD